uniref:hypothetical protein n=1 Tax=Marinovum sp. TaxID=2024839 RepID=UPI003A92E11B
MKAEIARARLAEVPRETRDRLMQHRAKLPAGALAVVARFFEAMEVRGEHVSAPSRESFLMACGSESTLGLLLRVLDLHTPSVCLAEGRALRRAYYRERSRHAAAPGRSPRGQGASATEARNWPPHWQALLPGLQAAPIRESSKNFRNLVRNPDGEACLAAGI